MTYLLGSLHIHRHKKKGWREGGREREENHNQHWVASLLFSRFSLFSHKLLFGKKHKKQITLMSSEWVDGRTDGLMDRPTDEQTTQ